VARILIRYLGISELLISFINFPKNKFDMKNYFLTLSFQFLYLIFQVIGEWKAKVDDLAAEIDASQKECRNYNSELFRLKAAWDETIEQLDVVKRENKNLADEIKDLLDQLGDGGRSIHELDKQRRRLEVEKEELQAALEEAEAALEQEENKVLRAQLELGQVRQEIDRKIQEKEEEFNNTRYYKNILIKTCNVWSN
jgi:myosin heavy chain 6/7